MAVWAPLTLTDGGSQRETLVFVPELRGAFTLDLGLTNRFNGVIAGQRFELPPLGFDLGLGWRHYLDPWGRFSLGANLGVGLAGSGDPARPSVVHPRVATLFRFRGFDDAFDSFTLGLFADVGPMVLRGASSLPPADFPTIRPETTGVAASFGLETGPGMLASQAPYIFGEACARVGVEVVELGGFTVWSIVAGVRVGLDWARPDPDRSADGAAEWRVPGAGDWRGLPAPAPYPN